MGSLNDGSVKYAQATWEVLTSGSYVTLPPLNPSKVKTDLRHKKLARNGAMYTCFPPLSQGQIWPWWRKRLAGKMEKKGLNNLRWKIPCSCLPRPWEEEHLLSCTAPASPLRWMKTCRRLKILKGTSNGKTSIVRFRTRSFFAFRFKKKRMFAFFSWFQIQNLYRTCLLRFDIEKF